MSDELKPCPFCGSEAGLSKGGRALCSNEGCIACDLFAPVEDWNRRAQPAEAEGLKVAGFLYKNNGQALTAADMDADTFALMARSDFDGEVEKLVRQTDHLAALSAVTAERDRLQKKWARVETERDQLRAEVEALRKDAERYQWLIKGTYDLKGSYWFPSLRSHDHQNPTEAIDAAMAAKEE